MFLADSDSGVVIQSDALITDHSLVSLPSHSHLDDQKSSQNGPDSQNRLTGELIGNQDTRELAAESIYTMQRFPLTEQNLHRLAMSTNSESSKAWSVQSSKSGISGNTSRGISMTSKEFENRALLNGILDVERSTDQQVADAYAKERLTSSRESASPTQSQYDTFANRILEVSNDRGTIAVYSKYVFEDTEDHHFDIGYRRKEGKAWTEIPQNIGFNSGLPAPKPDMIEGYSRNSFPSTIDHIKASRLVSDDPKYVALPHMAVEYRVREKSLHEAQTKAGYNGAAMVYGRNEALKFIGKSDPPRQPVILTATATGQKWNVYGHYSHLNDGSGREEYYQCRMAGGSMENLEEYKHGRKVLRNMQDFAREQSSALRDSIRKDYDEYGSCQFSQRSGNANEIGSSASRPLSVRSNTSSNHDRQAE